MSAAVQIKPSSPELATQEVIERLSKRVEFADFHPLTLRRAVEEIAPIFFAAARSDDLARWLNARESSALVQKETATRDGTLRWVAQGREEAYRETRERVEGGGE